MKGEKGYCIDTVSICNPKCSKDTDANIDMVYRFTCVEGLGSLDLGRFVARCVRSLGTCSHHFGAMLAPFCQTVFGRVVGLVGFAKREEL